MNWTLLIIIGIIALGLIIFIVRKNIRDKMDLEEKIKKNYPKPRHEEDDIESDQKL